MSKNNHSQFCGVTDVGLPYKGNNAKIHRTQSNPNPPVKVYWVPYIVSNNNCYNGQPFVANNFSYDQNSAAPVQRVNTYPHHNIFDTKYSLDGGTEVLSAANKKEPVKIANHNSEPPDYYHNISSYGIPPSDNNIQQNYQNTTSPEMPDLEPTIEVLAQGRRSCPQAFTPFTNYSVEQIRKECGLYNTTDYYINRGPHTINGPELPIKKNTPHRKGSLPHETLVKKDHSAGYTKTPISQDDLEQNKIHRPIVYKFSQVEFDEDGKQCSKIIQRRNSHDKKDPKKEKKNPLDQTVDQDSSNALSTGPDLFFNNTTQERDETKPSVFGEVEFDADIFFS